MGNNHGGKRNGAGRKKQNITDKVLNGQAATTELPQFTVSADLTGAEMPKPNEYLTKETRQASTVNRGKEIYERLWNWLKERDCHLLVNPESLQQYALSLSRCEQAENAIHDYGFLAKHPTTNMPCESPYVRIAQKYQKQAQGQWSAIEVNIAERLRYFVDKNAVSSDPLDAILNRAVDKAGR